ncbi:MAG: glycogen-binding domain-containing protein [Candidatus Anammoxibacter sp.]
MKTAQETTSTEKPKKQETKTSLMKTIFSKKAKEIFFELNAPVATRVALTGDFNNWDPAGIDLKKKEAGLWEIGVKFKPGRYEYKFIVDNEWWTDPANGQTITNTFGSLNSVMEVAN